MTLTLTLDKNLETRLARAAESQSLPINEVALKVLDTHLPVDERSKRLAAALQSWMTETDPSELQEGGDEWLQALDADRSSDRKLFPAELKGVTW